MKREDSLIELLDLSTGKKRTTMKELIDKMLTPFDIETYYKREEEYNKHLIAVKKDKP